jgi:glutathione S-transferase
MNQKPTLFYRPGACALAPHILLHWLQRDHDAVNAPRDESYRKINPSGAVPALQLADGSVLTQCNAILNYLAEESGRADLLGGHDLLQRAEVAKWTAFFTGDFHPAFFPIFGPGAYTTDVSDAARSNVKQAGLALVRKHLATIEQGLASRTSFVGARYTIADAYSVPMLRWATTLLPETLAPWPNTDSFYRNICKDAGVAAAMAVQGISA